MITASLFPAILAGRTKEGWTTTSKIVAGIWLAALDTFVIGVIVL